MSDETELREESGAKPETLGAGVKHIVILLFNGVIHINNSDAKTFYKKSSGSPEPHGRLQLRPWEELGAMKVSGCLALSGKAK